MHKTHIWIIAFLSVLSITLAIMLAITAIKYKKETGNVPVDDFYNKDYADISYHINDDRNYGYGQCSYDRRFGLLIRERKEGDFYIDQKIYYENTEMKLGYTLYVFNYGENCRIFDDITEDRVFPIDGLIKEVHWRVLDRSSFVIKMVLHNKKYGDAGLTDIILDTYDPNTDMTKKLEHKDVFVTPLALKHIQDRSSVRCLVFFQLIKSNSKPNLPDEAKSFIAVGDYFNTYFLGKSPR